MEFTNLDYKKVEDVLLHGKKLNSKQREFIELFETKTIIAGPGTGKTTSLAAKIALMLLDFYRNNINDGICIITHTNVAVNEINNALQKAGVGKIKHPHFIGTIHEFFNKFCVTPFFKIAFKNNALYFSEQHEFGNLDTYMSLLARKYSWMDDGVKKSIAKRIEGSHLVINQENKSLDIENTTNWDKFDKYKTDMYNIKLKRKSQGFLTHNDTFLFSELFLFSDKIVEILRNRFKYIFIDEFQDTNKDGERLLDKIFKTEKNIIQKIGDPYQTIGYGEAMPEIKEEEIFRLNVSNRFGKLLGNHLNIIIPDANIETNEDNISFNPILLVYNNPETVGCAYEKIKGTLLNESEDFANCKNRDSILVLRKESTNKFFKLKYKEDKKRQRDSAVSELKKLIIEFLHKRIMDIETDEKSRDIKQWIIKHEKIYAINEILTDMFKVGLNETLITKLKNEINSLFSEKGINAINKNNHLFKLVEGIIIKNCQGEKTDQLEDQISTIHSVKGETHRSVLLLDYKGTLTSILLSRYMSPDLEEFDFINRNLLYVAMSRARFLFVFAISEDDLSEEIVEQFKILDWHVKYIQELI